MPLKCLPGVTIDTLRKALLIWGALLGVMLLLEIFFAVQVYVRAIASIPQALGQVPYTFGGAFLKATLERTSMEWLAGSFGDLMAPREVQKCLSGSLRGGMLHCVAQKLPAAVPTFGWNMASLGLKGRMWLPMLISNGISFLLF